MLQKQQKAIQARYVILFTNSVLELTAWKATVKQQDVFAGISLTWQPGGAPVLPDAGVSKLYPLVYEGEGSEGWKGSSWGFVFVKDRIMLSNGALHVLIQNPFLTTCISVRAIYTKSGGKNGMYLWVPSIANISSVAMLHVQLFRHIFHDRYSRTHNIPVLGINQFTVIAPWQFLCTITTPRILSGGKVVLEGSSDQAIFEALTHSMLVVSMCMKDFILKQCSKVIQEEADDAGV